MRNAELNLLMASQPTVGGAVTDARWLRVYRSAAEGHDGFSPPLPSSFPEAGLVKEEEI